MKHCKRKEYAMDPHLKTVNITIKFEQELKKELAGLAIKRGMDLSKLARAILTNYVRPGTFIL
jgi:hypothetical protein